jgi:hypothetical protein
LLIELLTFPEPGVAWDPQNKFLLSQSMDRTLRIYRRRARKGVPITSGNYFCCAEVKKRLGEGTVRRLPKKTASSHGNVGSVDDQTPILIDDSLDSVAIPTASAATASKDEPFHVPTPEEPFAHKMFLDESVSSFFRRICWSPCGNFFFAPTGSFVKNATSDPVDCTFVFSRDNMTKPMAFIPCPSKASIIVRCNPVLFKLRNVGSSSQLLNLNYRIVFAIATVDSVLVYDTQHIAPLLVLRDIHYASISDIAWSPDGFRLAVSSTDGFCSFVKFEADELGAPLSQAELDVALQRVIEARVRAVSKAVDSSIGDETNASTNKSMEDDLDDEDGIHHGLKRKTAPDLDSSLRVSPSKLAKTEDAPSFSTPTPFLGSALPSLPSSGSKKRLAPTLIGTLPSLLSSPESTPTQPNPVD